MRKFFILFFPFLIITITYSQTLEQSTLEKIRRQAKQTGALTGKIRDEKTGEDLIGASVSVINTKLGGSTDIDGRYEIKRIPEGTVDIRVSFIGYETKVITGISVKMNEQTTLDASLNEDQGIQHQEVVISATAIKSGEGAILAERKKAASIGDGISAEQMKRAPDATSGDALKRVPGVTIVDNKFVFVRGTSERYSNTTLNGATLSGAEPEKKSFSFDMFPSNLLENIVIAKTFTPDMQGDFSGGNVQLSTVDFPEYFTVRASVSNSFNTAVSTKSFVTYNGGKTDWLGMDDGTRALPGGIPSDFAKGNIPLAEQQAYASLFSNNWAPKTVKAPTNNGFELSLGNAYSLFDESQFGFISALTYKNSFSHSYIERNDYETDRPKFEYQGERNIFSVLWGGMFNMSFKYSPFHKISSKNVYNNTSEDEVTSLSGLYNDRPSLVRNTGFRFTERSIVSTQLIGDHVFVDWNGIQLQWRAANSESNRSEPDSRRVGYFKDATDPDDIYRAVVDFQAQTRSGGRFYSNLKDIIRNYAADITVPIENVRIKIGGLYEDKDRTFNSRLIAFVRPLGAPFDNNLLVYAVDSLYRPENIKSNGFRISEYSNGSNNYTAAHNVAAYYVMTDIPFTVIGQNFRFTSGARVENFSQKISSLDLDNSPLEINPRNVDVLPSANLTYQVTDNTNFRLAYSQTVNRPELRELAQFAYYDFTTQLTVYGNPKLRRALIKNYDVRYEFFPNPGEIISISYFYKKLTDAIEMVNVPGSALGSDRTFDNANGENYGYELEFRTSLGHFTEYLDNFAVTGNFTQVKSRVSTLTGVGIEKRDRPLQGQSPYMINLSLLFALPEHGFNTSVMFNKFGERISEASTLAAEDIREMPRNVLDVTVTKSLFQNFEMKLSARDVFKEDQVFKVMQGDVDRIARSNSMGTTYSLGLSYKL